MLLENYDWGLEARTLQILFGLGIGLAFGIAAQISRFCLRRAIAGDASERGAAAAVWLTALASALVVFQIAQGAGFIDISDHRYFVTDVPVLAIVLGGLAFGVGMVLTRGCASRLTVLSATGNLRAVTVLVLFAVVAHAALKGVLAPLRVALTDVTMPLSVTNIGAVPLGMALSLTIAVMAAAFVVNRTRPGIVNVALGAVIGVLPVLAWATTSTLLLDEFDPLPVQALAFTLPWTDTLFWTIASSAVPAGFGTGLMAGVLAGAFLSAALRRELEWQGFESPAQMGRYGLGATLMGVGGVLAGGCTIGAGLSGVSALSVAAVLALVSIVMGGLLGRMLTTARNGVAIPAE